MAGRIIAPAATQIFNPDALQQIYASKVLGGDPMLSGPAYAFLKNQQGRQEEGAASYMDSLKTANALNAILEQQDIQAGVDKTIMQQGVEASDKLGIPLDALKAFQMLVSDPNKAGAVAGLTTDKMRATIAKLQSEAANAGRGGSSPSVDTTVEITPFGVIGKVTGKKGATVSEDVIERTRGIFNRQTDKQRAEVPASIRDAQTRFYLSREPRD